MLSLRLPSYLTAHPNMLFDFDDSYLMEIVSPILELVPQHLPKRMCYAVVGKVIWTDASEEYFNEFFRSTGFQVPPGATALCPGTGKRIKPSATEVNLFVIGLHMATAENNHVVRGIFPRILTFEGFDRMRGTAEEKYVQKEATCMSAASFWFRYRDTLEFKTREDFLRNLDCIQVACLDGSVRIPDHPYLNAFLPSG
jgi:hypothetical protein